MTCHHLLLIENERIKTNRTTKHRDIIVVIINVLSTTSCSYHESKVGSVHLTCIHHLDLKMFDFRPPFHLLIRKFGTDTIGVISFQLLSTSFRYLENASKRMAQYLKVCEMVLLKDPINL